MAQGFGSNRGPGSLAVKWEVSFAEILFEVKRTLVDGKLRAISHVLHVQIQAEQE